MIGALLLPMPTVAAARPASLSVSYTSFQTPVKRGKNASVTIHTGKHVHCSIKVVYANGTSHAAGLGAKYSTASGNASWTWKVPKATQTGRWPVTVTCQSGHTSRKMSITA